MQLFKINDKGELDSLNRLFFEETDVYLVDDKENNVIYIWVGSNVDQNKKDITAEIARKLDKQRGGSIKILIMKQKREYGSFLAMMHDLEKGLIPGKTVERRPEFVFKAPPKSIDSVRLNGTPKERVDPTERRIVEWLTQLKDHRMIVSEEKPVKPADYVNFAEYEEDSIKTKPYVKSQIVQTAVLEVIEEKPEEPDLKTQIREAAYYLSLKKYTYDELCWILSEKIQKINMKLPSIEDIRQKAEEVFRSGCTYDELCWLNAEMDILMKKSFLEKDTHRFVY